MLEKIINNTKIVKYAATLLFLGSMYACSGVRVNSPISNYVKQTDIEDARCYEFNVTDGKEKKCVYPILVVHF